MTSPPNPLPGEASPNRHGFIDLDGNNARGHQVIFPIVRQVDRERLELLGTGFFISENGLFVSAKHVLRDAFDESGNEKYPIGLFHFLPDNSYEIRHFVWCSSHKTADVAIGLAQPAANIKTGGPLRNPVLTLTMAAPSLGETVATYAYPKTRIERSGSTQILDFQPAFYDGKLEEYLPQGQGRLSEPCYRTSMSIHGGASGGPVVGKSGHVFAINSSSFDGAPDISYVSRINEILQLEVPSIKLSNGQDIRSTTILEFSRAGWVDFNPPLS